MAETSRRPVLYLVACGGRPAGDLPPFVTRLQDDGWDVCVIATPSGLKFMDTDVLRELTGHVVRADYKQPEEPDVLPPPDAMVVAPATFNTICKWAHGTSDTLALGLLNEAIGLELPIVAVPTPSVALAKHPAFVGECRPATVLGRSGPVRPGRVPVTHSEYGSGCRGAVSLGRPHGGDQGCDAGWGRPRSRRDGSVTRLIGWTCDSRPRCTASIVHCGLRCRPSFARWAPGPAGAGTRLDRGHHCDAGRAAIALCAVA